MEKALKKTKTQINLNPTNIWETIELMVVRLGLYFRDHEYPDGDRVKNSS